MGRKEPERLAPWLLAAAAVIGASAAAYGILRLVRQRRGEPGRMPREYDSLESAAVEALRRDPVTGRCGIDVAALAPGILELSGSVPTQEVGQRAARLLHAVPGVKTVLNRLDIDSQQRPTRAQWRGRGGGSGGGQWNGMNVGMGRRRQGAETDPAQRDDSQHLRDRSIVADMDDADDASQVDRDAQRGQPT